MSFKQPFAALLMMTVMGVSASFAQDDPLVDAFQEYMMFSEYEAGIILPRQIDQTVFESVTFIDTRDAGQYEKETIPGAVNIEWREVFDRIDEIPDSQMTILFCNTGSLSAQAAFALRVAGHSNVLVLQGGIVGWKQDETAYKP